MDDKYQVSRGDIITCSRFRYTTEPIRPRHDRFRQVGSMSQHDNDDPSAVTAKYYVLHVTPIVGRGETPLASQTVTILRLKGLGGAGEVLQFEAAATCHEIVRGRELTLVSAKSLVPVPPNCMLTLQAKNGREAEVHALSIYGFAPTSHATPSEDGKLWRIAGYKYDDLSYPIIIAMS